MASLTNNTVASTYQSLIKIADNSTVGATPENLTDGLGNATALSLSSNAVSVSGSLILSGSLLYSGSAIDATASYALTASHYVETDPIFVSLSASLATTGSNVFNGNQTITGSVEITGSSFTFNGASVSRPYKVYTATIFMGDGTATVFENTLGVTITWTATSGQISTGTVAGLIGQNNVYVQVSSATPSDTPKIVSGHFLPTPWSVTVKQTDNAGVADNTQQVCVEIRVYN